MQICAADPGSLHLDEDIPRTYDRHRTSISSSPGLGPVLTRAFTGSLPQRHFPHTTPACEGASEHWARRMLPGPCRKRTCTLLALTLRRLQQAQCDKKPTYTFVPDSAKLRALIKGEAPAK